MKIKDINVGTAVEHGGAYTYRATKTRFYGIASHSIRQFDYPNTGVNARLIECLLGDEVTEEHFRTIEELKAAVANTVRNNILDSDVLFNASMLLYSIEKGGHND